MVSRRGLKIDLP